MIPTSWASPETPPDPYRSIEWHLPIDVVKTRQRMGSRPVRPHDGWVNFLAQRREATACLNRSPQG